MNSQDIVHKGWVFKQSDFLKKWRLRFMVATKTVIATYESEDLSKTPTCSLFVKHCRGVKSDEETTKKKYGFKIDHDGKDFLFYVDNEDAQKKWLNMIGFFIRKMHCF